MKTTKAWLATLLLTAVATFAIAPHSFSQEKKVVKIAYVGPLTGPNTAVGIGTRNSLQLALDQANAQKVFPFQLQLISETDDSKPSTGADAVKKICDDPGVIAASAHWNSPVALATSRFFHECGLMNLISGAASDRLTKQGYKEITRVNTPFFYIFPILADKTYTDMNLKNVAVIKSRDDFGNDIAAVFRKRYEELGGKIVAEEGYNIGERDFTTLLTKVRALKPEAVMLFGYSTEAALVIRQMRQLGIDARFLGASSWQTQTFVDTAGPAAEGSIVATSLPTNEELGAKGAEYLAAYAAGNFKEPPDVYGPFGYAAGQLLVEAIKKFGPDRKAIADGFRSLRDVDTIFGKVSVDPDGEVQPKQVTFAILKNGKFIAFDPSKK